MTTTLTPNCKCCPRCGHIKLACNPCCYCAPAEICFSIWDEYEVLASALLTWDEDLEAWTGSIKCGADGEAQIEITLGHDEYGNCYWHVYSYELDLDNQYPVGDDYSDNECGISIDIGHVEFGGCSGRVEIRSRNKEVLPYYRGEYGDEGCPDYFCSKCKCVCEKVCFLNDIYEWNGSNGWDGALGTITIHRDEYTGSCIVTVPGYIPLELAPFHQCDDWSLTFTEEDGYGTATLTCWQCTCAREIPCPEVCVNTGNILVGCGALSEYPVFYLIGQSPRSPLLRDDGSPLCCEPTQFFGNDPGTCIWEELLLEPGECEWTFHPEDGPKVQLVKGDFTWVWTSDDFDPLCTSVFTYDPDQSTPDPDCDVYTELCVTPNNACCDGENFRDRPMPTVLHAEGTHCCGVDPMDPDPQPVPYEFDLTWDPSDRKWKGETTICSGFIHAEVYCICGSSEGCGQQSDPCYNVDVTFQCFGGALQGVGGGASHCSCEPFELTANLAEIFATCCAAELLGLASDLVVFE